MSLSSLRTIKELADQCLNLGVTVEPNAKGKYGKTEYIIALRKYFLEKRYKGNIPKPLELILKIDSPMLCSRFTELKEEQKQEIWESYDWILQEKLDGVRMLIVYADGKWDFFSRNNSVDDFLPISYKGHILENWGHNYPYKFILDCELTSTDNQISTILENKGCITECQLQAVSALLSLNSQETLDIQQGLYNSNSGKPVLKFNAFDCLYYNGDWLINEPLYKRDEVVKKLIADLSNLGMLIEYPLTNISNKKAFYKALISAGKEGCVAKNIYGTYQTGNNRSKTGFVKIKRSMSETIQMMGIGDTIDAFVTGFEVADAEKQWAGLVGCLEFSIILKNNDGSESIHKIAKIASFTDDERKAMTEVTDGKVQLKKNWYNKVAEIDGQCISAREKRLRHARLVNWRVDKSPSECLMTESFLNSMVL